MTFSFYILTGMKRKISGTESASATKRMHASPAATSKAENQVS